MACERAHRHGVPEGSQVSEHGVGPGSVVAGRFRLEDLLEEAQGARFWRATDLTLARNVAVHVLDADDPRAPAALTAARTSALVSDSHILRVLDAVEQEDVVFLVHEWGTGVSLDQMLVDDVLDAKRAAWLVREVAQAIVAGHTMGVAHGRLIPENVMISEAGSVKLVGFVVNCVLHGRPETTADGSAAPSEHESDVLNLGALLYACLVGRWPGFPASTLPPAPREHGRPLRPRRVKAGVPKFLDTLCEDILASGAKHGRESGRARYESAAAVAEALSRYLGDGGGALPVVNAFTELGGPTAFVDPSRAPGPHTPGTLGSFDDDPESGEAAAVGDTDPEATQAAPVLEDSSPGRAMLRSQLSDSSAEARAQVDTEERSFERDAQSAADEAARLEKSRAAREALGRRSHGSRSSDALTTAGAAATAVGGPESGIGSDTTSGPTDRVGPPPGGQGAPGHTQDRGAGRSAGLSVMSWGPDAHGTGSQAAVREPRDEPGALWLRLAALVAVLVLIVVGVLLAFNAGSTRNAEDPPPEDESGDSPVRAGQPVEIADITSLDPPSQGGNGEERDEDTVLAFDGDPATAWRTETYFDGPELAPYKQGLGLVVDLGEEREVRQVDTQLVGQGYDVTLYAAEPGAGRPPTDITGLQQVARERGTVGDVTFEPGLTTQYLVVWFRALPETSGGYAGEVAEIVVRS